MSRATPTSTTVDLSSHHLQFDPGGSIHPGQRLVAGGDDGGWTLALFHAESSDDVHADYWEMHPLADEAVCCLHGALRLFFRATRPDTPDDLVHVPAGHAVIVPRGEWHRLELDEPTELLSVTVRPGTELVLTGLSFVS